MSQQIDNAKLDVQAHIDADEYDSAIVVLTDVLNCAVIDTETRVWALQTRAHCYSWCAGMDDAASVEEDIPTASQADEDVEKALSDLNAILEISSLPSKKRVEVLFERITELRWLGRNQEAVDDCNRILDTHQLSPADTVNAYFTRADLNLDSENTGRAIDDIGAILKIPDILDSTRAEALEFRADIFGQAGEIYKALDDLHEAMNIYKITAHICGIKRIAEKIYTYSSMI